ncbi:MAG: hypothetical protein U9Q66_01745 [Patescibacteria group bacterium]|nr:hypothetical protein [Patescibacteria group bacterium]
MQASLLNKTNSSIKKNQKIVTEEKKIEVKDIKKSIKVRTEEIDYLEEDNGLKILADYKPKKNDVRKEEENHLEENNDLNVLADY